MDVDAAWCPACDRLIQPKRFLVNVPVMPPAPPPSPARQRLPKQAGLVSGTGRLKHLKQQQQQRTQPKQRLVIDDAPIPLYCSDACQLADVKPPAPQEPTTKTKTKPKPKTPTSTAPPPPPPPPSEPQPQDEPGRPLTSREQFAKLYNITIPPPPPVFDDPRNRYSEPECTGGVIMAGRLIRELCAKAASKPPEQGRYRSAPEPTKIIRGWNDGSNAWRAVVYGNMKPSKPHDPLYDQFGSRSCPRPIRASSSSAPAAPSPLDNKEMIANFSDQFKHSRTHSSNFRPAPLKKERSLVKPGAEGKLLVPDVKLKVRCGSSTSIQNTDSTTPRTSTSRRSSKSPRTPVTTLSDPSPEIYNSLTIRRPTVETRSWSYDNVKTYPMMQVPPTKVKKIETQIIDGEEREVEVEVEVYEEPKRLFLFAPKVIVR